MTVAGAVYLGAGLVLAFRYRVAPPDAVSRMANGFYVLYSRHPHLGAIGFVWNPLQSICDMVPLLFKDLWAPIATNNVAGVLVSALCMTGAVHQLRSALEETGVSRSPRIVLTALFGANPMILYYGANGMSEALYLFTVVAVCRYLQRWARTGDLRSLVASAIALGLCYLARNEAVGIAVTAAILVFVTTLRRHEGSPRARRHAAATDAAIFLLPVAAAFAGWAAASYVISGQPFQQFTSQYGNTSELAIFGSYYGNFSGPGARLLHEAKDMLYLAPLLPQVLLCAIFFARRRRDWRCAVPIVVLGGGLGFIGASYLENQVFPWYRFYILAIPLTVLLVGALVVHLPRHQPVSPSVARRGFGPRWSRRVVSASGVAMALLLAGPSLPATALGMFNPSVGIEESHQLGWLVHLRGAKNPYRRGEIVPMLAYLERMHLGEGSVVTDEDLHGCATAMIVRSNDPKVFVIPNDVDFKRILADPLTFRAHYLLVPEPTGYDVLNAVNEQFPGLYRGGGGFATRVASFPATDLCPPYRLYRVTGHPPTL